MSDYNHKEVEPKWQKEWEEKKVYRTEDISSKTKQYILDMFPYPSGAGLHVGHPKGYIATDVYSRMKRMQDYNVLHPMGWDAFGLPAEQYAIKNKVHPRVSVEKNVARYKEQLSKIGLDYDWSREINTTDPAYYKWTQWAFLQMYEKGLAYQSHEPINWCPSCQTGLANEDLEDGKCERCGSVIEKHPMRQWVLRITDYADRMLKDLDELPKWPEHVKESQRNWIGRSEGAEITFKIENQEVKVFTTRPDTLFGATYMVLAPEHAIIHGLEDQIENMDEVKKYIERTTAKTEIERLAEGKEKTGVELKGIKAINPANNEEIPVWIADYVLVDYGTGAIMAVPAHDERDFEFAKKFNLPIRQVIAPEFGEHQPDEEFRDGGCGVIFDPEKQQYAFFSSESSQGRPGLFSGGIDEGEDMIEGIQREVEEESGFYDFKEQIPISVAYAHYYNPRRKLNRVARAEIHLFILKSTDRKEQKLEEHEDFEVVWREPKEVYEIWKETDPQGYGHWMYGLKESVAYAIEAGFDTVSDPEFFKTEATVNYGHLENSGEFNGLRSEMAKQKITEFVGGEMKTTYRLKDWVFSRQRYWGEPIPIIHCESCGVVPVPYENLPVELPEVEHYEPTGTGESPLAAIDEWVNVKCPKCGGQGKRETNTMPQWAGSNWYYLRYMDPGNSEALVDQDKEKYWGSADVYVGGMEHATRHLIYARFWHKFLYDIGVVSTKEPFLELHTVGLIQAEDGRKMSKRWGNVVNPDEMVDRFGADAFRVYEMFMGPFGNAIAWNTDGVVGTRRFIEKVWRIGEKVNGTSTDETKSLLHKTIKKVSEDIQGFEFNTAISQMMILANHLDKEESIEKEDYLLFLQILAPFAPHVTEELWHKAGNTHSIHLSEWPNYDESLLVTKTVSIGVQVNGKVRATVVIAPEADEKEARKLTLENEDVQKWIDGKEIKKFIYVPGRIISLVV